MILDSKTGKKYVGFYRGQVMSHLGNGNCKIWIPGVYPESWCETESTAGMVDAYGQPLRGAKLPTASMAMPPFGGTIDEGFFAMPAINSMVWCFFENDDSNFPVYFAQASSKVNTWELDNMTASTEPKPQGRSAAEGNPRLKRDVIIRFGGAYILFSPNKKIELGFESDKANKNAIDEAKSKAENSCRDNPRITLNANGTIEIRSGSMITVDSSSEEGVQVKSHGQEVVVHRSGIAVDAEEGGVTVHGNRTVNIKSDFCVDIQNGQIIAYNYG